MNCRKQSSDVVNAKDTIRDLTCSKAVSKHNNEPADVQNHDMTWGHISPHKSYCFILHNTISSRSFFRLRLELQTELIRDALKRDNVGGLGYPYHYVKPSEVPAWTLGYFCRLLNTGSPCTVVNVSSFWKQGIEHLTDLSCFQIHFDKRSGEKRPNPGRFRTISYECIVVSQIAP